MPEYIYVVSEDFVDGSRVIGSAKSLAKAVLIVHETGDVRIDAEWRDFYQGWRCEGEIYSYLIDKVEVVQ